MRKFFFIVPFLFLVSCENYYTSSIPTRPVHMRISVLEFGSLVNFNAYAVLDATGFYEGSIWRRLPLSSERWGYGGVVVYNTGDNLNPYTAFDLCCPLCADPTKRCQVTGMYAECPGCGEKYDLSSFGMPTQSIGKEALRRYPAGILYPYINVNN